MCHIRTNSKPDIDFFKDSEFKSSLDAEMKRLQSIGLGSKRQAGPITSKKNCYGKNNVRTRRT